MSDYIHITTLSFHYISHIHDSDCQPASAPAGLLPRWAGGGKPADGPGKAAASIRRPSGGRPPRRQTGGRPRSPQDRVTVGWRQATRNPDDSDQLRPCLAVVASGPVSVRVDSGKPACRSACKKHNIIINQEQQASYKVQGCNESDQSTRALCAVRRLGGNVSDQGTRAFYAVRRLGGTRGFYPARRRHKPSRHNKMYTTTRCVWHFTLFPSQTNRTGGLIWRMGTISL